MNKSSPIKFTGIAVMIAGFLLFVATWGSQSFWVFAASIGLAGSDLSHPLLSWLGLAVMAIGLSMLYQQTPSSQRSVGKKASWVTAIGIAMAALFTLGLIVQMPKLDAITPVFAWLSLLLMFVGGWIAIVLSVREAG